MSVFGWLAGFGGVWSLGILVGLRLGFSVVLLRILGWFSGFPSWFGVFGLELGFLGILLGFCLDFGFWVLMLLLGFVLCLEVIWVCVGFHCIFGGFAWGLLLF